MAYAHWEGPGILRRVLGLLSFLISSMKGSEMTWLPIRHEQIYLNSRGHAVDIHVYPILQRLWDAGIQTFYSCQGGPRLYTNDIKIKSKRAYVVILEKDRAKTMKILKKYHPEESSWENRVYRDRISIKFDAPHEANLVHVEILDKVMSTKGSEMGTTLEFTDLTVAEEREKDRLNVETGRMWMHFWMKVAKRKGYTNAVIANHFKISESTVRRILKG